MHPGADEYLYRGAPPPELRREAEPPSLPPAVVEAAERRAVRTRRRRWGRCAGLLLLPFSVALVFRAADADGPSPVPQLLAFLPWFLVPAWLALACAALGRRIVPAVWALAVLAATGWFLRPYGPDAAPAPAGAPAARLRVLTANLDRGTAVDTFLALLRDERPQLVAVQECDTGCARALRSPEVRESYPGRVIVASGASQGSALLSTYPLRSVPAVPGTHAMPGAVVDVAGARLRFQVVHSAPPLPDGVGVWRQELGRLAEYAGRHDDGALLMAGDFNASQDHAAFRGLLATGLRDTARLDGRSRTPTWPARTAPPLGAQLDHVLVSEDFDVHEVMFFTLPDADHRAVLAEVALR
ncbi:endonuclease/exonuclease/phosphatase family protein [Streptomyces sp. TR02-1]|uniref:endonuclease/exonuclease/phosphatase family protein n=1 Tax=Streptomyces sp. TR02-1 TaxID=3385977 RepID=UPI00399FDD34